LQKILKIARLAALFLAIVTLDACGSGDEGEEESVALAGNPATSVLPNVSNEDSSCKDGGALYTELYGALAGEIEWYLDEMQCQGMPRPGGAGVRLRFSGAAGEKGLPIAFIIGLPGLERDTDGVELPSNVTIIDEENARFFSTPGLDSCWTDVEAQWTVDGDSDRYRIDGVLFCITPLPEVNGEASVSVPELRFSGILDWSAN
jgi:hypothetical protein